MLKKSHFDYFLSYSRDIDLTIVQSLVETLDNYGIKIWFDRKDVVLGSEIYDDFELLLNNIKNWKGAIIFFDHSYFSKKWCQRELDAILYHNIHVLPILYKIPQQELFEKKQELLRFNFHIYDGDIDVIINKVLLSFVQTTSPSAKFRLYDDQLLKILVDDYLLVSNDLLLKIIKADSILTYLSIKYNLSKKAELLRKIVNIKAKICIQHDVCTFDDYIICDYILENIIEFI